MKTRRMKRVYEQPAMRVFELLHKGMLLGSEGMTANRNGYGAAEELDWE